MELLSVIALVMAGTEIIVAIAFLIVFSHLSTSRYAVALRVSCCLIVPVCITQLIATSMAGTSFLISATVASFLLYSSYLRFCSASSSFSKPWQCCSVASTGDDRARAGRRVLFQRSLYRVVVPPADVPAHVGHGRDDLGCMVRHHPGPRLSAAMSAAVFGAQTAARRDHALQGRLHVSCAGRMLTLAHERHPDPASHQLAADCHDSQPVRSGLYPRILLDHGDL
ncbi:hypothetical protein BC831DRAFT_31413 [Entophlyctis helioformis]|nr:hypothetical protein BC831DRAFT_31413 [Entophlyctis helioformis]